MNKKNNGIKERIYLTRPEADYLESRTSLELHVKRYGFVRQYAEGLVLDIACGVGYGTYLLQKNPDVSQAVGVDNSNQAIKHAKKHFVTTKTKFICAGIETFVYDSPFDVAVSLETIEHLRDPNQLVKMFNRNKTRKIILSFPTKKSTHFNPFHFFDFKLDDIKNLFLPSYKIVDNYEYLREFMFVFLDKAC